jgi:hypothetical protein
MPARCEHITRTALVHADYAVRPTALLLFPVDSCAPNLLLRTPACMHGMHPTVLLGGNPEREEDKRAVRVRARNTTTTTKKKGSSGHHI